MTMKINNTERALANNIQEKLAQKYGQVILECAKVVLVNAGVKPLVNGDPVVIESNLVTADTSKAIVDCAKEMACRLNESASEMAILTCILTAPQNPTDQNDGDICPVCGGELDFDGAEEIDYEAGRITEARWRCLDCGAHGTQVNDIVFSHHEDVKNCKGEDVDPDSFIC